MANRQRCDGNNVCFEKKDPTFNAVEINFLYFFGGIIRQNINLLHLDMLQSCGEPILIASVPTSNAKNIYNQKKEPISIERFLAISSLHPLLVLLAPEIPFKALTYETFRLV